MSSELLTITEPSANGVEINMDFFKSPNVLLNFLFSRNATQEIIPIPFGIIIFSVVTKNKPVLLSIYFTLIAKMQILAISKKSKAAQIQYKIPVYFISRNKLGLLFLNTCLSIIKVIVNKKVLFSSTSIILKCPSAFFFYTPATMLQAYRCIGGTK